jgi:hypothetical protein
VGGTILLPAITSSTCDGTDYKFARWQTNDQNLHEGGTSVQCSVAVLGGESANITGILCDCNGYTYAVGSICYPICDTRGACEFNSTCTLSDCASIDGVCESSSGNYCLCAQPRTNTNEPQWVTANFFYNYKNLIQEASPNHFFLDKNHVCPYAYSEVPPANNCGENSPYRLTQLTQNPVAEGYTFKGFVRKTNGTELKVISALGRLLDNNLPNIVFPEYPVHYSINLVAKWE